VIEGRKVFGNVVKYIRMGASSNFGNMFSVLGANTPAQASLFQTGWFVESIISQTLIIHVIRTQRLMKRWFHRRFGLN